MNKLEIKSLDVKGKTQDEIINLIMRFPFYMQDKIANKKKRTRWVFNPEKLTGDVVSKIYLTDEIILGLELISENEEDLLLTSLERELQLVDVYEFPFSEMHKFPEFVKNIINKKPLRFHWQNTNKFHDKYVHPFFKNVLGIRNSNYTIRPDDVGLNFPYKHPEFKNVNQDILIIESLYFKRSHLIAYKVFNRLTYQFKTVWSMEFYEYLNNNNNNNNNNNV